jgi:hypothetical protein
VKAEVFVRGRRLVSVDTNVTRLPAPPRPPPADPLEAARDLIAAYEALPHRDRNYRSKIYADLFCDALGKLAASCTPLREEAARQLAEIMRRAEYGDGPARALAQRDRHLRPVRGEGTP